MNKLHKCTRLRKIITHFLVKVSVLTPGNIFSWLGSHRPLHVYCFWHTLCCIKYSVLKITALYDILHDAPIKISRLQTLIMWCRGQGFPKCSNLTTLLLLVVDFFFIKTAKRIVVYFMLSAFISVTGRCLHKRNNIWLDFWCCWICKTDSINSKLNNCLCKNWCTYYCIGG